MTATITNADRAADRARAESIATRWVPAHMTARQGLVDDITAALENARQLGIERGEEGPEMPVHPTCGSSARVSGYSAAGLPAGLFYCAGCRASFEARR